MSAAFRHRPTGLVQHRRAGRVHAGLQDALQIVLIWISFIGYSFAQAPIPAANEPHYLTKAYHYWNPSWCDEDLFLESSNAHLVFYQTFGLLTVFLSLPMTAVIGRMLALLLLAMGWCFCLRPIIPQRWGPLPAAWVWMALTALGNFSGEWVIGGIESKVVAYGFLLFAIGHAVRSEFCRAGVHTGLAIAFHPVIGVWGAMALAGMAIWGFINGLNRLPVRRLFIATVLLLLASAPGLIPALLLIGGGDPAADHLQVFVRLGHHLDPLRFPIFAWLYYAALILVWLGLRINLPRINAESLFTRFVFVALLIAFVGLVIGLRTGPVEEMWFRGLRTGLLKFYWFRLADIFVPMAAAVSMTRLLIQFYAGREPIRWAWPRSFAQVVVALILVGFISVPYLREPHDPSRMSYARHANWIEVCRWISGNTPEDGLFFTPRHAWAFTWYSDRSDYFAYKNMPQDAASLLEWNNRRLFQQEWWERVAATALTPENEWPRKVHPSMVDALKTETEATHVVLHNSSVLPLKPLFSNESYSVYQLRDVVH